LTEPKVKGESAMEEVDTQKNSTEEEVKLLRRKVEEMNADFGEKRAKFKALFLEKEEELEKERSERLRLSNDRDLELVTKLRGDLQVASKLRSEMEAEWTQLCEDFQTKLATLEAQIRTYEVVLLELNASCQQSIQQIEHTVKKLSVERNELQKQIQQLECENDNLQGKYVAHSQQLQNECISLPNSVMELQEMVLSLKEELIRVKIGKELLEGELKFYGDRVLMEEEEKKRIEESFSAEINDLRNKLKDAGSRKDQQSVDKHKYEKAISELKAKLLNSENHNSKITQMQSQIDQLKQEKEVKDKDTAELILKITTLKKELMNSEELQRDLISLSKSLQMGLESIRQAETEVRWQHPDDIGQCNSCKRGLHDNKEKFHCSHCGRVFCAACTHRNVRRGQRDYRVCDFCHTLLVHNSAPYFSTEPPYSPE